jgi:chromosome segregation ATPase
LPHGYNEALETLKDSREEIEEGAVAIIRDLLDALTRSEQARQDMEIERDAAQDQCAGAERFGREQELRAVTAEQARQEAEQQRDQYRTLAAIGVWHADCRPNRAMAARELAKSQAVIDKLADTISSLRVELANMTAKHAYEERRANTLRDERNKCTEAARLNGTADVAALRAERVKLRDALTEIVALNTRRATRQADVNFAQALKELSRAFVDSVKIAKAALASTPPSQEPTKGAE